MSIKQISYDYIRAFKNNTNIIWLYIWALKKVYYMVINKTFKIYIYIESV